MSHIPDDLLLLYAHDASLAREEDVTHLAACVTCAGALADHRAFDDLLRDPTVWTGRSLEADANDQTLTLHNQIAEEDRYAAELLGPYEEMEPARFVWLDVARDLRFHSGGVVRRLCKRAHTMCERDPLYALAIADTAVAISSALSDAIYPSSAVHELRGEAWKERTNALGYLGRFTEAFEALEAAETEYGRLPHAGAGLVSVAFIRASLLYEQEQFGPAESFAEDAARAAQHLGLMDLYLSARHLVALIRSDQQKHREALEIGRSLLAYGERSDDEVWIARESLLVGGCELELGNLVEAEHHLARARTLHAKLGATSEVTRTDWCIARLRARAGHTTDAVRRLRTCIAEFSASEMLTDAALVAVDLAEVLIAAGRPRDVSTVLAGVARTFAEAGKLSSAMTALAYLNDAAATPSVLSTAVLGYVRRFIMRADRDRELVFVPPPLPL